MKPLYPALFLATFALGGCDKKKELDLPRVDFGDVSKEAAEWMDAFASKAAKERSALMAQAGRDRAELNARIRTLKKEAVQTTGNARAELETQVTRLEQEQRRADRTLLEMRTALGEKWIALKAELNESIGRMKGTLDAVQSGA